MSLASVHKVSGNHAGLKCSSGSRLCSCWLTTRLNCAGAWVSKRVLVGDAWQRITAMMMMTRSTHRQTDAGWQCAPSRIIAFYVGNKFHGASQRPNFSTDGSKSAALLRTVETHGPVVWLYRVNVMSVPRCHGCHITRRPGWRHLIIK